MMGKIILAIKYLIHMYMWGALRSCPSQHSISYDTININTRTCKVGKYTVNTCTYPNLDDC